MGTRLDRLGGIGVIGWYVHHVGRGHITRADAIRTHLRTDVTTLSSLDRPTHRHDDWVTLDRDDGDGPFPDPSASGALHWVPLGHTGLQNRMARIAAWVASERPAAFVVDVSVEVTVLVRLLGVPVIVMAGPGRRHDAAHQLAYTVADQIIAPWPREVYDPEFLHPFADKTYYVGAISRFDGLAPALDPDLGNVVVLNGAGGSAVSAAALSAAAATESTMRWTGLGVDGGDWVHDVWPVISRAGVIVCHAGQNALAEAAATRRPTVVIAQDRPFDEQHEVATALAEHGIVEYAARWPEAHEWSSILTNARTRGGASWSQWSTGRGAQRAAAIIDARAANGI